VFNVGGGELLVILVVALIVLGPTQLPKAARQVGQVMTELKRVSTGFQQELTNALDTEAEKPRSPGGPTERTEPAPGDGEPTA
jgi:sec-independent protein translocase protein TatB